MADKRNRTPFYGAVPTYRLNADHIFMADGSTLQELADKKFEQIEEITLTEDTAVIERTTEPDTTPYNFKEVIVVFEHEPSAAAQAVYSRITDSTGRVINLDRGASILTTKAYQYVYFNNIHGMFTGYIMTASNDASAINVPYFAVYPREVKNYVSLRLAASTNFISGSKISIYAVRA